MRKAFPWLRHEEAGADDDRVVMRGEKVVLREKLMSDAADDYAWRTDEELSRLDATRPITMSYEAFYRYSREEMQFEVPTSKRLSIDTLDGRHIGNCMYYDVNLRKGEAELGIMIGDREFWGRGYGSDAVKALLNVIFTNVNVYLHTLEWNERARKSFSKAGFREFKPVSRGGYKFVQMEIFRSEWEKLREVEANGTSPRSES